MSASEHQVFKAMLTALPETAAFLEGFCSLHCIARPDVLRLTLIVEELFTNTVQHGYGGASDAPIYITLSVDSDHIGLLYEDAAPPYDPLARLPGILADLTMPLESRPVGALGIHLIRQLSLDARYVREDGRNRLRLSLPYDRGT